MEREVRRMGAVDEQRGVVTTGQLGQRSDVAGGAVIRWVQYPQRLCAAVAERPLDDVRVDTVRDAEPVIPAGFQPDGSGADLHQSSQYGLVRVAGYQHRFVGSKGRERNGDVAARRPLNQDEALADAPRVGDQALGLEDRPFRAVQRVGVRQVVEVDRCDVIAEPRVQRPATLVARAVERRLLAFDELTDRLEKRCGVMFHNEYTRSALCTAIMSTIRIESCSVQSPARTQPPSTCPIARRHSTEPSTWSSGGPNASDEYSCSANGAVSSASATSPVERTPR